MPAARGRPQLYADTAIECALVVKAVFHLSLRSTQGFLESVVRLMGVDLPVPDYTTVCKRQRDLQVQLGAMPAGRPRHVVIGTTGLKIFGAGEWYVRKHGMSRGRRRAWRKLHLGVDEKTEDSVAVDLTTSGVHDSPHMTEVLHLVDDDVRQVSGDRAYDTGRAIRPFSRGMRYRRFRLDAMRGRAQRRIRLRAGASAMLFFVGSRTRVEKRGASRVGRPGRALPRTPCPGSRPWLAIRLRRERLSASRSRLW